MELTDNMNISCHNPFQCLPSPIRSVMQFLALLNIPPAEDTQFPIYPVLLRFTYQIPMHSEQLYLSSFTCIHTVKNFTYQRFMQTGNVTSYVCLFNSRHSHAVWNFIYSTPVLQGTVLLECSLSIPMCIRALLGT